MAGDLREVEGWHTRAPARYGCALVIALLAAGVRWSLNRVLGADFPYAVFCPSLMICAAVCGFGPAFLSMAIMALSALLWVLPHPLARIDILGLTLFAGSASTMCIIGGLYRRLRMAGNLKERLEEVSIQRGRIEQTLDQTQKELAEDLENTRRLHGLAARYVSQRDLGDLLNEMVDAAMAITHTHRGTLQFFDTKSRTLQIHAAKGFSREWVDFFQTVDGNWATCGEAMRRKARVIVPDVRHSPVFAGTPALDVQLKAGVAAVQSTPLISRSGEFLGMISTHFGEVHTPKERELHWMDLLARQAADLLERSHGEQVLRESEQLLRTVTAEARVGLVVVDRDRRYVFANQTYLDLLGRSQSELIGKHVGEVMAHLYEQVRPQLDRAFQGERFSYELRLAPRNGVSADRFFDVIYEPRGNCTGVSQVVVVIVDVTERKRMQHILEETVEHRTATLRETIQELETLSYGIAHDLRAPLRAMQGFSKILQDEYSHQLDARARDYVRRICVAAGQLDELTRDVLSYSRIVRSELPVQSVQTGEFLHQIIESYPNLQSHQAQIHVDEPMPPVLANPAALTQVFSNLLGNAVKFTRPGVEPDVRVRAEVLLVPDGGKAPGPAGANADRNQQSLPVTPLAPKASSGIRKDRVVRLWFEDNGIGIRKDLFERIFLMFHRTHSSKEYEGTGIGLTIVRKAVERMGGAVGLESELGKGSRFWIELPEAA